MARTAFSWTVPTEMLEEGLRIVLEPVEENGLPQLSQIAAPRGFLPEGCAPSASVAPARQLTPIPPKVFAAPRGFLPDLEARS